MTESISKKFVFQCSPPLNASWLSLKQKGLLVQASPGSQKKLSKSPNVSSNPALDIYSGTWNCFFNEQRTQRNKKSQKELLSQLARVYTGSNAPTPRNKLKEIRSARSFHKKPTTPFKRESVNNRAKITRKLLSSFKPSEKREKPEKKKDQIQKSQVGPILKKEKPTKEQKEAASLRIKSNNVAKVAVSQTEQARRARTTVIKPFNLSFGRKEPSIGPRREYSQRTKMVIKSMERKFERIEYFKTINKKIIGEKRSQVHSEKPREKIKKQESISKIPIFNEKEKKGVFALTHAEAQRKGNIGVIRGIQREKEDFKTEFLREFAKTEGSIFRKANRSSRKELIEMKNLGRGFFKEAGTKQREAPTVSSTDSLKNIEKVRVNGEIKEENQIEERDKGEFGKEEMTRNLDLKRIEEEHPNMEKLFENERSRNTFESKKTEKETQDEKASKQGNNKEEREKNPKEEPKGESQNMMSSEEEKRENDGPLGKPEIPDEAFDVFEEFDKREIMESCSSFPNQENENSPLTGFKKQEKLNPEPQTSSIIIGIKGLLSVPKEHLSGMKQTLIRDESIPTGNLGIPNSKEPQEVAPCPKRPNESIQESSIVENDKIIEKKPENQRTMENCLSKSQTVFRKTSEFVMRETLYKKPAFLPPNSKTFVLNSNDFHIQKFLLANNFVANPSKESLYFDLKWTATDTEEDYKSLSEFQFFNHFQNNRAITAKSSLSRNLKEYADHKGVSVESFYPPCYDLGIASETDAFKSHFDFNLTISLLKKVIFYFKKREPLQYKKTKETIRQKLEDLKDDPKYGTPGHHSKRKENMKKKGSKRLKGYISGEQNEKFIINFYVMESFLPFLQEVLYTKFHIDGPFLTTKQNEILSKEIRELVKEYAKLPAFVDECDQATLAKIGGARFLWKTPNEKCLRTLVKLHLLLKEFTQKEGYEVFGHDNIWIVKPGMNARGSGIFLSDNLEEILTKGEQISARVVQKYVEQPLLISIEAKGLSSLKFDIRQWVLVKKFKPLRAFIFSHPYGRLCSKSYETKSWKDPLSHLSNFSINKKEFSKKGKDIQCSVVSTREMEELIQKSSKRKISWKEDVYPQINEIVLHTLRAGSKHIVQRKTSFELYGYDILLDSKGKAWLLEINLSPACQERGDFLPGLLQQMTRGLFEIILPKSWFPDATTPPIKLPESSEACWIPLEDEWGHELIPLEYPSTKETTPEAQIQSSNGNQFCCSEDLVVLGQKIPKKK